MDQLNNELKALEEGNEENLAKVAVLETEKRSIEAHLEEIGDVDESVEELEELSNSMSLNMEHLRANKKHRFTLKDRIFFNKLTDAMSNFVNHNEEYIKICELEGKTLDLIGVYNREADEHMQQRVK